MITDTATNALQSVTRLMSGSLVTLSYSTAKNLIWSTSSRWLHADHEFGFQAGPRGMERDAVMLLTGFTYSEEYRLQGRQVVLGSGTAYSVDSGGLPGIDSTQQALWFAAWLGATYVLITSEFDAPGSANALLNRLASFDIHETAEGISLRQKIPDTEFLFESATVEVPGIGTVRVRKANEASSQLPLWGGTRVRGGELFRTHQHVADDRVIDTYVLANESAFATIDPSYADPGADIASGLALLRIDWSQGANG